MNKNIKSILINIEKKIIYFVPVEHKNKAKIFKNFGYYKKMTYFVKDECIKCKLMDCVEVCPVDCFYEGENMLVIHPEECIDCGVCEPECPVEAIVADTGYEKDDKNKWLDINNKYSKLWPNITKKKEPPKDADKFRNEKNKYDKYFSDKPGE